MLSKEYERAGMKSKNEYSLFSGLTPQDSPKGKGNVHKKVTSSRISRDQVKISRMNLVTIDR